MARIAGDWPTSGGLSPSEKFAWTFCRSRSCARAAFAMIFFSSSCSNGFVT
jgi:hypothetical protein